MKQFKYNVGDHVVIKESNIEYTGKYAGETGVIVSRHDSVLGYDYEVHPDKWGKDLSEHGIYCKVKCLVEKTKKYKVGDHVVVEESNIEPFSKHAGLTGVIVGFNDIGHDSNYPYIVCFDDKKKGSRIYCKVKCLVPHTEKIVITTDGKTTTATLYDNDTKVKSASAKCSPDDKFDFAIGAAIAMDRLYPEKSEPKEEAAPKYLSCKFVLSNIAKEDEDTFTEGKIYTMVNGTFVTDDGVTLPFREPIKDKRDLHDYFNGSRRPCWSEYYKPDVIVIKEDC